MELEVQYDELRCCSCVLDTVLRREEMREAIVPDALEDIGSVVNVSGTVLLQRCTAMEGSISCEAAVDACVLFTPDEGGSIRALSVQVPIRCITEAYQVKPEDKLHCTLTLAELNVKVMNPRKVLVRVEITMHIQAYTGGTLRLANGIRQEADGLQLRRETIHHCYVVHTAQRSFCYEEGITIGAGQRRIDRLLHCGGTPYCTEGKVTGARILLKGGVRVCLRYIGQGEQYTTEQYDIPVPQVLDAGAGREGDTVIGHLTLMDLQVCSYDEGSISISMELMADCVILQQREIALLTDAYSTRQQCQCRREEACLNRLSGHHRQLYPFRQNLEVELPGMELIDQTVTLAEVLSAGEGSPRGKLKASLCLRDGTGRMLRVEQPCLVDLPCQDPDNEVQAELLECVCILSAGGAELRGTLLVTEQSSAAIDVEFLSQITLEEEPQETTPRPSAVLRRLQPGETLWDVAKCCCATVEEIMVFNQINSEADAVGRFLLVPRHR